MLTQSQIEIPQEILQSSFIPLTIASEAQITPELKVIYNSFNNCIRNYLHIYLR